MAVPAAVTRARWEVLILSIFVAASAKAMECLLRVAHRWSGVVHRIGLGLPDIGDAEIPDFVAVVTAANLLAVSAHRVVAGDAAHSFEVAVTLMGEGDWTKLGGQGDHGLFGWDCIIRVQDRRCQPTEEDDPAQPAIWGGLPRLHGARAKSSNEHVIPPCRCWAFLPTR